MPHRLSALAVRGMDRLGARPDGAWIATDDALLIPVRWNGRPAMLKTLDPAGDETAQPAILRALAGRGAVRWLAGEGAVYLMERVSPVGPSLAELALGGQDDGATAILCDLIGAMQAALHGAALPGLMPLSARADTLRDWLGRPDLPRQAEGILRWGLALFERLAGSAPALALHGDMHHMNALHGPRGWLAIDPKGVLGPPLYDYANLVLNPLPHTALVHDPERMARVAGLVAGRTGADRDEVLAWVAAQAVLGLSWSLLDDERDYWWRGALLAGSLAGLAPPGPGPG